MKDILAYYTSHSPFTDPGPFAYLYDDLPNTPDELAGIVGGLLLHKLAAEHYNLTLSRVQRAEQFLRTIEERLSKMVEVEPSSLIIPREPQQRQVGMCRDFSLLHVSMLRHKGIAARMRVGFAKYLNPRGPLIIDHWIVEYWDTAQGRWILTDPEIDEIHRELMGITTDMTALVRDEDFYLAGSAWQLCRGGKAKPGLFRFNGRWKGMPMIRGNLLHDFQALNKFELGVQDYWDELICKSETSLTVEEKTLLDRIAELTVDPDECFDELQSLFDELPRTRIILSKLRMLGVIDAIQMANPEDLGLSELDRLSVLAGNGREKPGSSAAQPNRQVTLDYIPYELDESHPAYSQPSVPPGMGDIVIRGARQHNLKNIDITIPRHKLVVITGVSGSGKSSLAFDTIYAEGQRRYVESLSSFARQFMDQMEKPQVDQITGLSPAIAIEQKTISRNPRSTVGTVTEILDHLRVLYARLGTPHCPQCGRVVQPQSAQQITNQLAKLPPGTRFQLLAPIVRNRKGAYVSTLKNSLKDGYTRARIDGEVYELIDEIPALDKNNKHNIELVVDRLITPSPSSLSPENLQDMDREKRETADFSARLMDSVETALKAASGTLIVLLDDQEIVLSEHNACPECDISFPELEPNLFSFNSPFGMCDECNGLGVKLQTDPQLIIVNPNISLFDGASAWHGDLRKKPPSSWGPRVLRQLADHYNVDLELPWNQLSEEFRNVYLYGSGDEKIRWEYESKDGSYHSEGHREARGAIYHIQRLFRQTKSEGSRRYYMQFMSKLPCPSCQGERLCPEARFVTIDGQRLPKLTSWSIEAIHEWVNRIPETLNEEQRQIGDELLNEIRQRLGFIRNVGLHYLTLDRPAPTLSGGEGQRIRLASQIGSGLVGVLYILDEPSIGLHARDHRALLDTLTHLRDTGNTVLVVEHDAATMRTADWIIDLGPGPGIMGGELVAAGTPEDLMLNPDSLTGQYLSGELAVTAPNGRERRSPVGWLTVTSTRLHNLKNITASFPLGTMTCVTGVSGSGKSSLIAQTLHPALARALHNSQRVAGPHDGIEGLEQIDKVINITQDPIGRNPRSNPGTYVGVLSEIRKVFAATPDAKALGYQPGRFSFNVKGGRCEECKGYGYKKVEMHFLPDVWVKCGTCSGMRFNRQTLEVTYRGKHIADVLDMDVQEALAFFANHPRIKRILQTLHDVGLDYIKLGQSALTLSGGEAQRVKLAKELSRVATGKTIYFLDEPTTGLHFADIQRLLDVLHRLVDAGNTVIVIEHNLDVIKTADWIIDLGPEGGDKGGYIVAQGTPEQVSAAEGSYTGVFLLEMYGEGTKKIPVLG
jgi:excinuclease ABC subunit A